MNDRDRRDSGRLMLISPERVFYAGLLGRPRKRSSGGFNIYTAMLGSLKITEGKSEAVAEVALVRPYVPHSVESEHPSIICLVIEPETVEPSAMEGLGARICGAEAPAIALRIRTAYETLRRQERRGGFTTQEFDQLSFGERLPDRNMDHRIRSAALMLNDFSGSKMTAADCAASVHLSPSRFLHLFKDQTGISFRAFRAWKRAASAALRQRRHQSGASRAGHRLSRLDAFQPLDPPFLRFAAARDFFRLEGSRDLPQRSRHARQCRFPSGAAIAAALWICDSAWTQEAKRCRTHHPPACG